jgi:hypothetical protein
MYDVGLKEFVVHNSPVYFDLGLEILVLSSYKSIVPLSFKTNLGAD